MSIHRYSFTENLISFIIGSLLSEILLLVYLMRIICAYDNNQEIHTIKPSYQTIIEHTNQNHFIVKVPKDIIEETEDEIIEEVEEEIVLPNLVLTSKLGRVQGPQNEESWYNLPMGKVVQIMRNRGYTEADYPFYIREDGVKMFGDFIMVAANLDVYPRGTVVQTSLGQGLVCDECEHGQEFDIAVDW